MIFMQWSTGDQFVFQIGLTTDNPFKSRVITLNLSNRNQSISITMIKEHDETIILTTNRCEIERMMTNSVKQWQTKGDKQQLG